MSGITAHNMAVCCVLAGKSHESRAINLFQQAIKFKCDAFGPEHLEVAVSTFTNMYVCVCVVYCELFLSCF